MYEGGMISTLYHDVISEFEKKTWGKLEALKEELFFGFTNIEPFFTIPQVQLLLQC